jgi:transposase-like protein
MPKKRFSAEQIVAKLRAAEVELSKGQTTPQVCKKLGISEQTYYRWRREYGGLRVDQAKRLKQLERENARLKKPVAEQAVDISILKEVSEGNF